MTKHLDDLYEGRAKLVKVAPATPEEQLQYLRGEEPKNAYCPTSLSGKPPEPLS